MDVAKGRRLDEWKGWVQKRDATEEGGIGNKEGWRSEEEGMEIREGLFPFSGEGAVLEFGDEGFRRNLN